MDPGLNGKVALVAAFSEVRIGNPLLGASCVTKTGLAYRNTHSVENPNLSGTRWRMRNVGPHASGKPFFTLEYLGHLPGNRWLDGRTAEGTVGLARERMGASRERGGSCGCYSIEFARFDPEVKRAWPRRPKTQRRPPGSAAGRAPRPRVRSSETAEGRPWRPGQARDGPGGQRRPSGGLSEALVVAQGVRRLVYRSYWRRRVSNRSSGPRAMNSKASAASRTFLS